MKCKYCKEEMDLIQVDDDPNKGFAHNIYYCECCATLLHNRVWDNKGNTWVKCNGEVEVDTFMSNFEKGARLKL